ncbi:MAG: transcription-repair coupling factor, partial [Lachnospiraceae bacterium]|nr:transcription-repair coupling factor [Lachnospiraceae bacterium]
MSVFTTPTKELTELVHLRESIAHAPAVFDLTGAIDAAKPHLSFLLRDENAPELIICADENAAKDFTEGMRLFDENVRYFPAKDLLFYQSDITGNTLNKERIAALMMLAEGEGTVVTTIDALMNRIPPKEHFISAILTISEGDVIDLALVRKKLVYLGYEPVKSVRECGEFAVRGGIIDIFPLNEAHPFRIELWDDEVDSIRTFDAESQKSIEKVKRAVILPVIEVILDDEAVPGGLKKMEADMTAGYERLRAEMRTEEAYRLKSSFELIRDQITEGFYGEELETLLTYFCKEPVGLLDYLPDGARIIYDEIGRIAERAKVVYAEFADSILRRIEAGYALPGVQDMLLADEVLFGQLSRRGGVILSALSAAKSPLKPKAHFYLHIVSVTAFNQSFDAFVKELMSYAKQKYRMVFFTTSRTRAGRLSEDLTERGIPAFFSEDAEHLIHEGEMMITLGSLKSGFAYPDSRWVYISENDLFGESAKRRRRKKRFSGEKIANFSELHVGDYVVHENYGLGIYQGMEKIEVEHIAKDYIKIAYAKGSNLYIPATQWDVIGKYSSVGTAKPKLATLGTSEWKNTKERVKTAVATVAHDLVELYAQRQQETGYVYDKDTVWQKEFEETFPYEETESQLAAIEDVKRDMESHKIMDRLICGDVGYGKTEIAIRAAFKAVQEGKQVVYLCPTTILCNQHYNTFSQRMAGYPVNIGMLSRFRSTAENKETVRKLKKGEIDIVIGTHRALSKDVEYKDLGLLIIDEEQRFGVNHKERIKQMKKNIDVMSLSATPIPRTLHMSLVGIRDMSVLEEAPLERTPIQTYVFEKNDEMIREAILREMSRGGQVYYVINRIRQIADVAAEIEKLVPEAAVAYAHGQMSESRLENIMSDFINREIDVLVATTIIEIGLDITNVNTIIIHDADQLGLSQLYQLRGRVGRGNRTAYAFLMYRRNKLLKEVAERRLSAIREFTDLGSGFKIAMRDLEIRGAGTLLGAAQSGH